MAIERLLDAVKRVQNPTALGLDTRFEYLPEGFCAAGMLSAASAAESILRYNKALVDALCDIVPAVKVQAAYYEMYGVEGMRAFYETMVYAATKGMLVIADVKRNDIGATAEAYAAAYLGVTAIGNARFRAFPADMVTLNAYLGRDGVQPFIDQAAANAGGVFVLVKTSNGSGGEFQDLDCGEPLYMCVARKVMEWNHATIGESGYGRVGAVVGATYPEQGRALRALMRGVYFLVPGYGAQGAGAAAVAGCFDEYGRGAIINASRSLLLAYRKQQSTDFAKAARSEALRMRDEIMGIVGVIK